MIPTADTGQSGSNSRVATEGFTEDQERRYLELVREGMKPDLAREEARGKGWVDP